MRWPLLLTIFVTACAAAPPTIPESERAICADGRACRSITVGQTTVRGHGGQKLFTELVTADPAMLRDLASVDAQLLAPDPILSPPAPALCPRESGGRTVEALHNKLIEGPRRAGIQVCSPDYQARYVITVRGDGSVACIENRFAYSCI
jgi:hypothetical protein